MKKTLLVCLFFVLVSARALLCQELAYNRELVLIFDQLKAPSEAAPESLMKAAARMDFLVSQAIQLLLPQCGMIPPAGIEEKAKSPLCLPPGISVNEIRSIWIKQLKDNLKAVQGLFRYNPVLTQEWLGRQDYKGAKEKDLFTRQQVFLCLVEAKKILLLLKAGQKEVRYFKTASALFSDDFSAPSSIKNWILYGDGAVRMAGGRLQLLDPVPYPDAHLWTRASFSGDFVIAFDFEPMLPFTGGQITSYCASPRAPAKDLSGSGLGTMADYFQTIACYHASFSRAKSGVSNLRRTGGGLWMCGTAADPCAQRAKSYHIEIAKIGDYHFVSVDGTLLHQYIDAGVYGVPLPAGQIGLRNWSGMNAYYDNFSVRALAPAAKPPAPPLEYEPVSLPDANPVSELPAFPEKEWEVGVLSVQSKIFSGYADRLSPQLVTLDALLEGAPFRFRVWNAFGEGRVFDLDLSARNREWIVKPDSQVLLIPGGKDTVVTVRVQLKNRDSLFTPLICALKTTFEQRPLSVVQPLEKADRLVRAVRIDKPVVIDGKLEEAEWQAGAITDSLRYPGLQFPLPMSAFLVYDNWNICFAIRCSGAASLRDEMEFYLSPLGRGLVKVVFDSKKNVRLQNDLPFKADSVKTQYRCVVRSGPAGSWTAELSVPYNILRVIPKPGDIWRMNYTLSRQLSDDKVEVGTWCGDFNAFWEFGYLMFE